MRSMFALSILVFVLAACGEGEPASPPAKPLHAHVELPIVGLLGALPPKEGRVTIEVDDRGGLRVDGKTCPWADLVPRLRQATSPALARKTKSGHTTLTASMSEVVEEDLEEDLDEGQGIVAEEPVIKDEEIVEKGTQLVAPARRPGPRGAAVFGDDGSGNTDVLLRIDRRVPWSVVGQVLIACAGPELKLWRIFHAVAGTDGRGEGAVAVFLPKDIGCGRPENAPPSTRVTLTWQEGPGEARPGRLATALRQRLETPTTRLGVHLVGRPTTPYGQLLLAMDAALRAAAVGIDLQGFVIPEENPAERCAEAPEQGAHHWALSGRALMSKPSRAAEGPGRSEVYVGVVNDLRLEEPEIEDVASEANGK